MKIKNVLITIEGINEKTIPFINKKRHKLHHLIENTLNPEKIIFTDYLNRNEKKYEYDLLILSGGSEVIDGNNLDVRDKYELDLLDTFKNKNKFILGICRGNQLIGLYSGLEIKNIKETTIQHILPPMDYATIHTIQLNNNFFKHFDKSAFGENILNKKIVVNSIHKQYVDFSKEPKFNLKVIAESEDKIPEIIIGDGMLGLQYHPENMQFLHLLKKYNKIKKYITKEFLENAYQLILNKDVDLNKIEDYIIENDFFNKLIFEFLKNKT